MCWHTLAHSRIVRTANESSWHSCLNRYKHTHTYIYIETLQHYDVCTDACLHAFLGPYSPFCMCLRTYVHAYVHTCLSMWYLHHIHTVVGSCICTQPLWCVRACMHACLHTYIHRCMHRSAYITCVHAYMHAHTMHIYIYVCMYTNIYMYTHTYTLTHIHTTYRAVKHTHCIHTRCIHPCFRHIHVRLPCTFVQYIHVYTLP